MTEFAMRNDQRFRLGFGIDAMKKLKVCPSCGTVSRANETECRECGTQLPVETLYDFYKSRHKLCGHCHAVVATEAIFCPACGRKLPQETNLRETITFERNQE